MNNYSRTTNTILNFSANVIYQFIMIVLAFLTRRVFIGTLGMDYLGINGLFTNILSFLSLAELGVGSAIYYSLYKAIAQQDKEKIAALTNYYKKLYNRIALLVFICGIVLLPFLKFIINLDENIPHVEIYYIISLLSSVFSYLFVYKTSIVYADQSGYKIKIVSIVIQFLKSVGCILIIYFLRNYILYISFEAIFGMIGNMICSAIAEKMYPFIENHTELKPEEKKTIWNNIKDMFMYKFSSVVLNNTDNILISILVSTNMVGIYSNYTMIYSKIFAVTNMFFDSFNNSIGNLNAKATKEKKYFMFQVISFLSFWIFSFACIGVFFCRQ